MFLLRYPFFLFQYSSNYHTYYEIVNTEGATESVFNQDSLVRVHVQ